MAKNRKRFAGLKRELDGIEKRLERRLSNEKKGPAIIISFASLGSVYCADVTDRPIVEWETYKRAQTGRVVVIDPNREFYLRRKNTKAVDSVVVSNDHEAMPEIPKSELVPTDVFMAWLGSQSGLESDDFG